MREAGGMRTVTRVISAALIAVVAILIVYSFERRLSGQRGDWPDSPLIGKVAPDFRLTLFDGRTFDIADARGRPVVLNFWASWCLPCAQEAEELNRAQRAYGEKVFLMGVNVMDDRDAALEFIARHGVEYPNGYDPDKAVHIDYGVAGVPETFFIAPDGKIVNKISGPVTFAEISSNVRQN